MEQAHQTTSSCHASKARFDYLLWGSLGIIAVLYVLHQWLPQAIESTAWFSTLAASAYNLINTMWWGITLGIIMVAVLSRIPREFVSAMLGTHTGIKGIIRATMGGFLLDLCSHGILMVGAKLYERGASTGQVIAFLVASPWNSFSLTLILIALIGLFWTLAFIVLSLLIAIISGVIFDSLVQRGTLPANPHQTDLAGDFHFWEEAWQGLKKTTYNWYFFKDLITHGIKESRMVLRWIFFGVLLASLVRAFVDTGIFQSYFGPSLAGLGLTILAATVIEVCSEGSTPIAADLLTRAHAPGNAFAFLMAGVATDYTEIMVLKERTRSWKLALFLPLVTLPQVFVVAWLLNHFS